MFRATLIFLFLVTNNSPILVFADVTTECLEELGLTNINGDPTPEKIYNTSCLIKCVYEKEGKVDSDGNFNLSVFPSQLKNAATECADMVKITDICRRVSLFENCIVKKTDPYWVTYKECEKYEPYTDESQDLEWHCYTRCQMILDGQLAESGKVNFSNLIIYNSNHTQEELLEKCNQNVSEEDGCVRDINMYYCVISS